MPAHPPDPARHETAAAFLQQLPPPWARTEISAHHLTPLLLDRLDATGWPLDAALRAYLTARPSGVRDFGAVLTARLRALPRYQPPPPRPACHLCGSSASSMTRSYRWPMPVCVPCATAPTDVPAPDPAARKAEVLALIRCPDSRVRATR